MTSCSAIARKTTELVLEGRSTRFRSLRISPGLQIILQVLKTLLVQTQSSHITFLHIPELKGRKCEASFPPCIAKMDGHLPGGWRLELEVHGALRTTWKGHICINIRQWASLRLYYVLLAQAPRAAKHCPYQNPDRVLQVLFGCSQRHDHTRHPADKSTR